ETEIAISDSILLKPSKLTLDEFEIMKTHVSHGAEIVKGYEWLNDALDVVQYHHERFDGSGYLKGLKGEEIPLNARIFTIADVFDALTSVRPYKEAFSLDKSISIMQKGGPQFFDPDILQVFMSISHEIYKDIAKKPFEELKAKLSMFLSHYFATDELVIKGND
ncbi:MAG: HD domain-containing protein, partial [Thermodesulfovibrionales bacterium]|nr:HD domain-containing protein [Thermodesulfovibrionales bacterium]